MTKYTSFVREDMASGEEAGESGEEKESGAAVPVPGGQELRTDTIAVYGNPATKLHTEIKYACQLHY